MPSKASRRNWYPFGKEPTGCDLVEGWPLSAYKRIGPAQLGNAPEVAVGGAALGAVLDGQRVGGDVASNPGGDQQIAELAPVLAPRGDMPQV